MKFAFKKLSVFIFIVALFLSFKSSATTTPNVLIFKEVAQVNSNLFVLGKNNYLYCFDANSGNIISSFELAHINGIFKKEDTLFAWNNQKVYAFTSLNNWTKIKTIHDNNSVLAVSAVNNETVIVFADMIYSISKKTNFKSPITVSTCFAGNNIHVLSRNKTIYEFNEQHTFVYRGKLDSALQVIKVDTQLAYATQTGIYKYQIINKQSKFIAPNSDQNKMVAAIGNDIIIAAASQILGLKDNYFKDIIVPEKCLSFGVIDSNQIVYTNQQGQCFLYHLSTKKTLAIGNKIKAYTIHNLIETEHDELIFTNEGFLLNLTTASILDFSEETGGINEVIKLNNQFVIAANNGLYTFSLATNSLKIISGFKNIICNGIVQRNKHIWVCSGQYGIFNFKTNKISNTKLHLNTINKGLILPSAYLIKKFDNVLFCTSQTGVYELNSNGKYWKEINQSGFVPKISAITYYGKKRKVLFISSEVRGITKTNDNGSTYESLNAGIDDTCVVHVAADSNGFYLLAKSGSMYFHDHQGIQWIKMNDTKLISFYLQNNILHCIDFYNNIKKIPTIDLKPEIEINWNVYENTYAIGQQISIPFRLKGIYGQNNHTVLQIAKTNTAFDEKFVSYSDFHNGTLALNLTNTLVKPGSYTIRVVGTEPYIATKNNRFTFTVTEKEETAKDQEIRGN